MRELQFPTRRFFPVCSQTMCICRDRHHRHRARARPCSRSEFREREAREGTPLPIKCRLEHCGNHSRKRNIAGVTHATSNEIPRSHPADSSACDFRRHRQCTAAAAAPLFGLINFGDPVSFLKRCTEKWTLVA